MLHYISNSHIFVNIPPKSPWHRPYSCREQQTAPSMCLHEMLLLKRFPKAVAPSLPLIFSLTKSKLCFCFVFFPSRRISSSATNAFCRISVLDVFQLPRGIWNLTGKAKYLISLSIHLLFAGIFLFFKSYNTALNINTRPQTPRQPPANE